MMMVVITKKKWKSFIPSDWHEKWRKKVKKSWRESEFLSGLLSTISNWARIRYTPFCFAMITFWCLLFKDRHLLFGFPKIFNFLTNANTNKAFNLCVLFWVWSQRKNEREGVCSFIYIFSGLRITRWIKMMMKGDVWIAKFMGVRFQKKKKL